MRRIASTLLAVPMGLLLATSACAQISGTPQPEPPRLVRVGEGPTKAIGLSWGGRPVFTNGGVRLEEYPVVRQVVEGSGGDLAGIRVGDHIVSVDGRDAREGGIFRNREPGTRYRVVIEREGREMEVTLVVIDPETAP